MLNLRPILLIARSVLIEAVRRREIYTIVAAAVLLIGGVMTVDFFNIEGLTKFYREVALKVMSTAAALMVIVLAARQLPREFERRTIYPLLARPITRGEFLAGKLLGVMLAAAFGFALFMLVFVVGTVYLKGRIPWALFGQYVFLQLVMMLVLATLSFWLSMIMHMDATITIGVIFYFTGNMLMTMTSLVYNYAPPLGKAVLTVLTFLVPQLPLFDLSEKTVHAEFWGPVDAGTIAAVTAYGLTFSAVYFGLALLWFRSRPL
ncbi:MAG: hypothetical protein Kow0059_05730 [Candidatus Sumerlaeia bacterium]